MNSAGTTTLQAVPGVGATVDVTVHKPGVTPDPVGVSAATPFVGGTVTPNSATASVGFVAGPPVKAGLNISADAHALVDALHTVVGGVQGSTLLPPPPPKAPGPPPCSVAGACQ